MLALCLKLYQVCMLVPGEKDKPRTYLRLQDGGQMGARLGTQSLCLWR